MPSPQQPNDVRLRLVLDARTPAPRWPSGFALSTIAPADAGAVHDLLMQCFDDEEPDFATWWAARSGDEEYDPSLVLLARDRGGALVGLAWCWSSGFIKDLAVAPTARRRGLGEALLMQVFAAFGRRGARHVDLKTNRVENAAAYALYIKAGMTEVDWVG